MMDSYFDAVKAVYFPLLLAFGSAAIIFAAIAPHLTLKTESLRPLGALIAASLVTCAWPLILPMLIAAIAFAVIVIAATVAHGLSDKLALKRELSARQ